jgi:hypothetical protein
MGPADEPAPGDDALRADHRAAALPADDALAQSDGELDEALEESFPASDPLATWSGADQDPSTVEGANQD